MLPQFFRLASREPQALADHVEAYSELIAVEIKVAAGQWQRRTALRLLGYTCFAIAFMLFAVAAMLWAVIPADNMNQPWLLGVVPLVPALVGVWPFIVVRSINEEAAFSQLRRQWAADRSMLNEVYRP
jgi:uncharacterized membrane protein YqjE